MSWNRPLVLGIETSCDDTACAVVDGTGRVLSSVVSSQLKAHRPYGGVVPEIASREHLQSWPQVSRKALEQAEIELSEIDAVAATRGPGLIGSLLVGLSLGRAIAFALRRPFHGMHHLEGHLFSPFLGTDRCQDASAIPAAFIGLVVSGGHASILEVRDDTIRSLVETRDDAMGEVFDKVGKRLGLPYPQGPRLDVLAERGDESHFRFSVPRQQDEPFFSFSGLKSQALRQIEKLEEQDLLPRRSANDAPVEDLPRPALDLLSGFRRAAVGQILDRLERLHTERRFVDLAVSGGVAANRLLRRELEPWAEKRGVTLRLVPLVYASDNAAMIAFAALERERRGMPDDPRAVVASRIPFAS